MNKLTLVEKIIFESLNFENIFYHGSTDKKLLGKNGIHIGTKKAATQALESRIGVPAEGEWDGTRVYGNTLLAGRKKLELWDKTNVKGYYITTGFNVGKDISEEDYFPKDRNKKAVYSDKSEISFNSKPIVFPVKIIGRMSNTPNNPHNDVRANSMMMRNLKLNNAKSGYFYINDGEDEGSLSAVVPNASFLKIL